MVQTKRSSEEVELLKLYADADGEQRKLIFTVMICAAKYGDAFFNEMQPAFDKQDKPAMKATLSRWEARLKAEGAMV